MQLPPSFLSRMQAQLGGAFPQYIAAMEKAPPRALRLNTLKLSIDEFLALSPWPLTPSAFVEESFLIGGPAEHIGKHPYHMAGLFYMQEPSATRPVALLAPAPHMRVLDLCAAPGGKSTQIAARLKGEGLLVANEPVPSRANILCSNLERMGATNAITACMKPEALAVHFPSYFDAILVDAPCSGEGMFRKEPQAVLEWSPAHVLACAKRQAQILDCAAGMLKEGGRLVYSTCTFSTEENELTVRAFLKQHPGFQLISEERHYPHTGTGEGQYAALLEKTGDPLPPVPANKKPPAHPARKTTAAIAAYQAFSQEFLAMPPKGRPHELADGRVMLLPDALDFSLAPLHLKSAGVFAGEYKKGRFIPSHGLGHTPARYSQSIALEEGRLTAYLHGETIPVQKEYRGYTAVLYGGFYIGLGRAVNGTLKNLLPKGLRQ
ncbi:RsmB/NOP family class I SAM-dependent RNA methyltransferase [Christensenellaceae bacterium OttesenSCG-928-M15]|nr:RsmB/NOP family class I SAM-dependent RNA methyltransferase [Christensenellaceae bacterium OttesenSCG-928-M15]